MRNLLKSFFDIMKDAKSSENLRKIEEVEEVEEVDKNPSNEEIEKTEKEVKEMDSLKSKNDSHSEKMQKVENEKLKYNLPPLELLDMKTNSSNLTAFLTENSQRLQRTLYTFGVKAKVENVSVGPTIITYEIKLDEGTSVKRVKKLKNDLALNFGTNVNIRIIPERQLVGIETERKNKEIVKFGEIIKSEEFKKNSSILSIGLGKDVYGNIKIVDLKQTSHVLVSGTTGSGKSIFLHVIINSILYKAKPGEVKFLMIDTKEVELSIYNKIPHLLIPVITECNKALGALAWLCQEMENRLKIFSKEDVNNIEEYNKKSNTLQLPYLILIIDEYADLVETNKKAFEELLYVLTKRANHVGINIIISTERPSVNIIKGAIKANISTRVSFKLPSQSDSRVVLDNVGAENLFGNGDMLLKKMGIYKPIRYQCAFISNNEIEKITNYIKTEEKNIYNNRDILQAKDNNELELDVDDDVDPFLMEAIESVVQTGQASISFIQRRFNIGYARAGRIIDQMEERGIISSYQGSKPREVLMSVDRWNELKNINN